MSTVTPFRQPIFPGDKGDDILAVRHALVALGHQLPNLGRTAGPEFVSAIERVQRNHGLHVDGRYGPTVHPIVAPHFTNPDIALYKKAAIRPHYVNPFAKSTHLVTGRIDQGVDYHGVGAICAIGDAEIVGASKTSGWPGGPHGSGIPGTFILYRLTNGRHAGRYVFVAEAVDAKVSTGQRVKAGDVICTFGTNAAPGGHPGIETGWGSKTMFLTYHQSIGHKNLERDTPAGACFARLLKNLGADVVPVDDGPEFLASYPYPDA